MALDNLVTFELSDEDRDTIVAHLVGVLEIITPKAINLTNEQRQQYGRLGDGTENFVVKVLDYTDQKPEIIPFYVDKDELNRDIAGRNKITPILKQLQIIFESLDDTHKLLGWDIYNSIIAIYRYVKTLSRQEVPGINVIYDDLREQFDQINTPVNPTPPTP